MTGKNTVDWICAFEDMLSRARLCGISKEDVIGILRRRGLISGLDILSVAERRWIVALLRTRSSLDEPDKASARMLERIQDKLR